MNPDSTRTPTGTLQWPLPVAGTITSQFGHRVDPITGEVSSHTGTDIACAEGTPILAAADGTVTVANSLDSWGGSYGYYIQIDHGGGLETLYAHCSSICVTTDQQVQAGQVIGYVGHTGRATGSHAISEQHIIKRLNLKTKMSITIFITHRYSSLRLADFILVLKDGELVESGSHQELQKAGKYYSELIKAQIEPIDHLAQLDET